VLDLPDDVDLVAQGVTGTEEGAEFFYTGAVQQA
jgi:hypothetical protein